VLSTAVRLGSSSKVLDHPRLFVPSITSIRISDVASAFDVTWPKKWPEWFSCLSVCYFFFIFMLYFVYYFTNTNSNNVINDAWCFSMASHRPACRACLAVTAAHRVSLWYTEECRSCSLVSPTTARPDVCQCRSLKEATSRTSPWAERQVQSSCLLYYLVTYPVTRVVNWWYRRTFLSILWYFQLLCGFKNHNGIIITV